jgi:hypothetical protein
MFKKLTLENWTALTGVQICRYERDWVETKE